MSEMREMLRNLQDQLGNKGITSKVPPSYDGRSSWFAYEDSVRDWAAYTELPAEGRGMACKHRLTGYAEQVAKVFDVEEMRDRLSKDEGVDYFLK